VVWRPCGPMGGVVAEYHGYRQRDVPPGRHLGLPSPFLTVIFTLDEPLRIAQHVDPRRSPGEYVTMLGGLHVSPAVIEHDGAQSGIQLQLSPLGARGLFGLPAGELAGLDVCASELLGRFALDVQERLRTAASWSDRFRLLDRLVGQRLEPMRRPPAEVCRAWGLLRRSGGRANIASVAAEVGWSDRHLARQFQLEVGLTPKAAARVIRFDRARRLIGARPGADVAARCGYTDQSHLVRDFVAFTGLSPTRWLAAEVGNLQVTVAPTGSDWRP
jgi:AraC-like DNA-binding protein